jgi:hypothetical protein
MLHLVVALLLGLILAVLAVAWRSRKRSAAHPTAKPQSSDQAPGEEVVQVNDRYTGGGPPPANQPDADLQHPTGG